MSGWKLVDQIAENLGSDWEVNAGELQCAGHYAGLVSGPNGMRLFFIARTEMLDPRMEHSCPPLGWLRVDGRFPFSDEELSASISLTLRESLGASDIATQIRTRLLPVYRGLLDTLGKHDQVAEAHSLVHPTRAPKLSTLGGLVHTLNKYSRAILGWLVLVSVLGAFGLYLSREKSNPAPAPQPEKPLWYFRKYDSGKFYFWGDTMYYRTVCESADCTPLLEHLSVLPILDDVRKEGLRLTVKQGGVEYHFKVEAMGTELDKQNASDSESSNEEQ
jgi:hypothetical protein